LLGHTLRHLAACGWDEVGINLHFESDQIKEAIGDGASWGVRVHYRAESQLSGTAGGVRCFEDWLGRDDVLVMYGDLLLDQDLGALLEAHRKSDADATLLVHRRRGSNSFVDLGPDGRILRFVERPVEAERRRLGEAWVNSGVQLLSASLRAEIPAAGPADLPRDVYARCADFLHLQGVPLSGYRCAIDSRERYAQAERALAEGRCRPGETGAR
jgi:NDP-sugar pyrophosphorylase family protein